jgi:hypothetical protein
MAFEALKQPGPRMRSMRRVAERQGLGPVPTVHSSAENAAGVRPTGPQRRYLERGAGEPGGKLPLFDRDGREVPRKTIEACIAHGWAEPWTLNPIKPDWVVCRLTAAGRRVIGA